MGCPRTLSIDAAVRRFSLDAIIGAGGVWRDKAVLEISGDRGCIAAAWVAEAAASGRVEEEVLARGDFLQALAFELLARGLEAEITGLARAPAVPPARREFGAVEGSEDLDWAGRSVLDLQLQPMAAALGAGAAGITAEFLAQEEQRRGGLDESPPACRSHRWDRRWQFAHFDDNVAAHKGAELGKKRPSRRASRVQKRFLSAIFFHQGLRTIL